MSSTEDNKEEPKKENTEKPAAKAADTTKKDGKKSSKGTAKKKSPKKSDKMTAGIDPKLAAKFKEKSNELKERLHKEHLEDKIRQHTISPLKTVVPGIVGILIVIICITFFSNKGERLMGGIDPATAPKISAKGEKALLPEKLEIPIGLKPVEDSYYTDTPKVELLKGGFEAVQEQKKAVHDFNLPLEVENEIGMRFRLIPPGNFIMGSPESEEFREQDEFQHQQTMKVPFYAGKTEVTVAQWKSIMGHLPHNSKKEPNLPVTGASLNDALVFVQQLNRKLPEDAGYKYFIISEEEWEYTCRAGTVAPYYFGHYILMDQYAVFKSSTTTGNFEPVGQKRPNPWGLHDMIGNAAEWTRSPYFIYACGKNQYAGVDYATAQSVNKPIEEVSWDIPVYDGEHPENLVDMFDKFDVPMRAVGTNIDICYWDVNNNKKYDNHEPIWKDSLIVGTMGSFDPEADVVILSFAKTIPKGTKGEKEGLYYHDKNLSTEWNPGEGLWARDDQDREYTINYVFRGGGYWYKEEDLRSATRFYQPKQNAPTEAGVRIVIYLNKFLKK